MAWSLITGPESDLLTPGWFQEVLGRLKFSQQRLLPSWWLSSGLLEAARSEWSESVLFLILMVANALFFRQLALIGPPTPRCAVRKTDANGPGQPGSIGCCLAGRGSCRGRSGC